MQKYLTGFPRNRMRTFLSSLWLGSARSTQLYTNVVLRYRHPTVAKKTIIIFFLICISFFFFFFYGYIA